MDVDETKRRHRELTDKGWVRRFDAEEPRLSEMVRLYEEMGYEVLVEPGIVGDEDRCRACFTSGGFESRHRTVYTRGDPTAAPGAGGLFD
jgi:hypothetical protein